MDLSVSNEILSLAGAFAAGAAAALGGTALATVFARGAEQRALRLARATAAARAEAFEQANSRIATEIERLRAELTAACQERLAQLDTQVQLSRFSALAARVHAADGYNDDERDALKALALDLRTKPGMMASHDFRLALRQTLQSFDAAGLDVQVDELHAAYGDALETEFGLTLPVFLSVAYRVLGEPCTSAEDQGRFLHLAATLRRQRRHEDALPYVLAAVNSGLLTHVQAPTVEDLAVDFRHFDAGERHRCVSLIERHATREHKTPRIERLAKAFQKLRADHGTTFTEWQESDADKKLLALN
jgi:hypothetical protein